MDSFCKARLCTKIRDFESKANVKIEDLKSKAKDFESKVEEFKPIVYFYF